MKTRLSLGVLIIFVCLFTVGCGKSAQPTVLRVAIPYSDYVLDPETNYYINWLEKETGFDIDYWTCRGTYTVIDPKSEMDEIIVTLFDCSKGPGAGTGNAVVVFSDASDYPQFLSDGFGYMGEYGAPYQFERE